MPNNSNLLNVYKLAYRDRTVFFKNSLLGILIVVSFVFGSFFFLGLLKDFTIVNLITTCIFWIIGLCLLPIFFLVLPLKNFLLWNLVISTAPFIPLFFNHQGDKILWLIWGIIFALILFSKARIKIEYNALINLQWIRIVSKGSFHILLVLVIALSTLVYFQENIAFIEQGGTKILDSFFSRSAKVDQTVFGIEAVGTIDEILKSYIQKQTAESGVLGSMVDQTLLKETKSKLSQILNYPVTGEEKISSFIVEWLKFRWQNFSFALKAISALFIFLIALSLLKFLNIIFSIILIALSWVFLQILLSLKYLKIKRIGIEKQELIIG